MMHAAQTELWHTIVESSNNYWHQSNISYNPIKACLHSDAPVGTATIYEFLVSVPIRGLKLVCVLFVRVSKVCKNVFFFFSLSMLNSGFSRGDWENYLLSNPALVSHDATLVLFLQCCQYCREKGYQCMCIIGLQFQSVFLFSFLFVTNRYVEAYLSSAEAHWNN